MIKIIKRNTLIITRVDVKETKLKSTFFYFITVMTYKELVDPATLSAFLFNHALMLVLCMLAITYTKIRENRLAYIFIFHILGVHRK